MPSPELVDTMIDTRAAQILEQAAVVAGNLKSYHFVQVLDMTKDEADVVATDRCRAKYEWNGSKIEILRIGKSVYEREAGTDNYIVHEDQFTDPNGTFNCAGDFLPGFRQQVSRLVEAHIIGDEDLDGHRVVHIGYTSSPPPRPFPSGSGGASSPPAEVWIEEQTARVIKAMLSIYEPEFYHLYSHFDEPILPPIERPAKPVTATPRVVPTAVPTGTLYIP